MARTNFSFNDLSIIFFCTLRIYSCRSRVPPRSRHPWRSCSRTSTRELLVPDDPLDPVPRRVIPVQKLVYTSGGWPLFRSEFASRALGSLDLLDDFLSFFFFGFFLFFFFGFTDSPLTTRAPPRDQRGSVRLGWVLFVLNYTWKMSPVAQGAMFVSKMDVVEVVIGPISPNLLAFTLVVVTAVVFTSVSSMASDVVGTCWRVINVAISGLEDRGGCTDGSGAIFFSFFLWTRDYPIQGVSQEGSSTRGSFFSVFLDRFETTVWRYGALAVSRYECHFVVLDLLILRDRK